MGRIFKYGDIYPITPGLQMRMPRQQSGGSQANRTGAIQGIAFSGFTGVKSPFDIAHKFKSIDKFGKIMN